MGFREFFEEDNGGLSQVRLMSFISLIMAVGMTVSIMMKFFGVTTPEQATAFNTMASTVIYILLIWIIGAFCPKIIQKFAEQKLTSAAFSIEPVAEKKEV